MTGGVAVDAADGARRVATPLRLDWMTPQTASRTRRLRGAGVVVGGLLLGAFLARAGERYGLLAIALLLAIVAGLIAAAWRPVWLLVGMVLLLAVGPLTLGPLEVVQIVIPLASLGVLVPLALRGRVRLPAWPVGVPLLAFGVIALTSTVLTATTDASFRLDLQLAPLLVLTVAVTTALRTWKQVAATVLAMVLAGAVLAGWALATSGPTTTFYAGGVVSGRAVGLFTQPNQLGLVTMVLLIVAVGVGVTRRGLLVRAVCLVSVALLVAALATSLSRGAWIGAVTGLVVLALLVPPARRPLAGFAVVCGAIFAVLVAAGVGIGAGLADRVGSLGQANSNPYDQRSLIWAEARRQFMERPWTGSGPGNYTATAQAEALRQGVFLDIEHAHNLVLNVAVDFGVFGVLALLALIAGLAALAREAVRSMKETVTRGGAVPRAAIHLPGILVAALAGVLAHTTVDFPLRNGTCIAIVWLTISVLAAVHRVAVDGAALARRGAAPRLADRPHEPAGMTS